MPRYAWPIKFFKRKNEKKESHYFKWKVSKKQVFLKKYYPIHHRKWGRIIKNEGGCETVWVEIFSKTRRAWTCFFVNLELIFALFFLFFILNIQSKCCCLIGWNLKEWKLIWKMVVFGKGVKFWGTDEKTKSNTINAFHPALKFYTLSFSFWFLRMPKRNYKWRIMNYEFGCFENGRHLQKTMQTLA